MNAARIGVTVPLALALLGGGCGTTDDPRGELVSYIEQANAIHARATPALREANAIYAEQAEGKLVPGRQLSGLRRAQDALRGERSELEGLRPPAAAARLQELLLRVVELNAGLTEQTVRLATYARQAPRILGPLGPAGRRLGRRLSSRATAAEQAAALDRYVGTLDRMLRSLNRLAVPVVLRPTHREQVRRLTRIRSLSRRLRTAAAAGDAPKLARLLLRFGRLRGASPVRERTLVKRGIAAYTDQLRSLEAARGRLTREQIRLNREVTAR